MTEADFNSVDDPLQSEMPDGRPVKKGGAKVHRPGLGSRGTFLADLAGNAMPSSAPCYPSSCHVCFIITVIINIIIVMIILTVKEVTC